MEDDFFVRLIVNKGFNNIDMTMIPDKKQIYEKAAWLLFDHQRIVEAVKCWIVAGTEMPKELLLKIANNE